MVLNRSITLFLVLYILYLNNASGHANKYSKEANEKLVDLKDPFRMGKINIIWEKARKRLSEGKLKKLMSELKIQDKDELSFKKLKSHGGDKEGFKEAQLRKNLKAILKQYGLDGNSGDDVSSEFSAKEEEKYLFKDKKLHKLWQKAEQSGFTQEQLKALKEEFDHHQGRLDEYAMLFEKSSVSPNDIPRVLNDIEDLEKLDHLEGSSKTFHENVNEIRDKHKEIKSGYQNLHKKISSGPESKEFSDPKVAGLWKLAIRSDFDEVELESLYTELKHYEQRLRKLDHLVNQVDKISAGKFDSDDDSDLDEEDREKIANAKETEGKKILEERLQKQKRKTEKLHENLEMRIMGRYSEL